MSKPKRWESMTEEERDAWMEKNRAIAHRGYLRNKEEVYARHRQWKKANQRRYNEIRKRWRNANKQRLKELNRRRRESITDSYIAADLLNVPTSLLQQKAPELIEAKRHQILLHRELKKLKNQPTA